ncbi:MAG: UDP-3-O-(3-hydroxymyristoyl)glucosamine N-acyltransferase [Gemmatimonadota bacterium]
MSLRASEIAELVDGTLEGADAEIEAVAPLDRAGPADLAFLADARYLSYLGDSSAGTVLVAKSLAQRALDGGRSTYVVVDDAHRALAKVLPRLYPERERRVAGVHPTAVVGPSRLGAEVAIGPYAVVGEGVAIGDRVRIGAHAVIGDGCEIAEDAELHAHVTLYPGVRVGARTILHSGVRVGVDGYGYVTEEGAHRKMPQVGSCSIGADVEIGANSTIDRGSIGATEIGDGVKIDNLVHIGHNVRVGENSMIVAQAGIAGSTTIGRRVTLAGQVGVNGHVEIGDDATLAAQAGVFGDVPAGAVYSGYPARPHREALRAQATLFRLPKLLRRLRALEREGRVGADEAEE